MGNNQYFKKELSDIAEWDDKKPIIPIVFDFDGTVVSHKYPSIGKENENCVDIMKKWTRDYNVGWILDTMRSGKELDEALKWCEDRSIKLYGIGKHPTQKEWTSSPKAYGIFSIDDRNVGVPLIYDKEERPRVDWKKIDELMKPILTRISKTDGD